MKPTTLLTLLATAAGSTTAATLPLRSAPTRPRDNSPPQHRLALLHTLTHSSPLNASNFRIAAAAAGADTDLESTKGGAILSLTSSDDPSKTPPHPGSTRPVLSTVQATLRTPRADMPTRGPTANITSGVYAASFWVGVDSHAAVDPSCSGSGQGGGGGGGTGGASLRAGVDVFFDGSFGGAQTPFAWVQYETGAGEAARGLEGFVVGEGDLVRFTLETFTSEEDAVVVLAENFGANVTCANGATPVLSVREVLPVPEGGARLCGSEAAWVIEDFPLENRPDIPVPLADFGSVTFGAAGVTLADGSKRDVTGAEVIDIHLQPQGGRLTSCEVVDGKKVKCARVFGDE